MNWFTLLFLVYTACPIRVNSDGLTTLYLRDGYLDRMRCVCGPCPICGNTGRANWDGLLRIGLLRHEDRVNFGSSQFDATLEEGK